MRVQFSPWRAWESRNDLLGIDESGVYAIGWKLASGEEPDLLENKIIYIGHTTRTLKVRLNAFDRACRGRGGHAGGNSFFFREIQNSSDYQQTWELKKSSLSVAIWALNDNWTDGYPELSEKERLNFVEANLLVDFVKKNKRLPKHNKRFG